MKLSLGFSPCPNDTYIFDALIHHKIDTGDLEFDVEYHDVETLNNKAFQRELAITKLSYHAFAYAIEDYELLDAGSALGFGVGPLLITQNRTLAEELMKYAGRELPEQLKNLNVAIPGKYTTANFLLGLAFPDLRNRKEVVFSDVERSVAEQDVDLGLIIHENRFTYEEKGLHKVIDLGDFWEKTTGSPIPLGGIVVRRDLPKEIKEKVNRLIHESVEYAFAHPKSGIDYIRSHAQEMDEAVMYKHIELYVNRYSSDLGRTGRAAIEKMFEQAQGLKLIPETDRNIFLTERRS